MLKKLLLLTCFGLLLMGSVQAQLKKIHSDPLIWTELQADFILSDQSFFYFRNMYRHNTDSDFPGLKDSGVLNKIYLTYILAGYDHRFTDHWAASMFARYTFSVGSDNAIFQGSLRHTGNIGSVRFIKRLAFDFIKPEFGNSRGRTRPFMALERNFKVGNHTLRPQLSYELFFYNNFQEDESAISTRTVDRTRLRIAASYKVTPFLWVTPYFMKQTEYYNALDTYTGDFDQDGNPILKEAGGKRNRIEPIIGLDLRFILKPERLNDETLPLLLR